MEVELRAGRGQRRCYGCGIENEARGSSADWPAPPGHTSLNVATRECCHQNPELTQLAVADSKGKKSSEPFPGILELRFGQRGGCLVEWWQLLLSPSHSNILNVTRPQTNSGSACVSLCAGQVLFDMVYLLVEGTCASTTTKKRQDRNTVSSAKRRAVLVPDASMRGAVVNRVCTRRSTRHGQWLCNEKAIAVLARRRSEILARCCKLFSFH